MIGNGFGEDVYCRDLNLEDSHHLYLIGVEGLRESIIQNGVVRDGCNCYRDRYLQELFEALEGFEERRTGIRVSEDHYKRYWAGKPIEMILRDHLKGACITGVPSDLLRPWWDVQRAANGGSELINVRSVSKTFYSRILRKQSPTQHVRFGMASSSPFPPEPININIISQSNIIFNGSHLSQHIGPEIRSRPTIEAGSGGDGGNGNGRLPPSGGARGGGGKDDDDGDVYDDQFSRFMKAAAEKMRVEANANAEAAKAEAAAKSMGTLGLMSRFGLLVASCWILGNPILADPSLLFKVGIATQVVTGSCFSTFAELKKKGMEFWSRLFAADILFGITVDIALVVCWQLMLVWADAICFWWFFWAHATCLFFPTSSIFEGGSPGFNISLQQQGLTYFYEGILFGAVGLGCGLTCHNIINFVMTGNRNTKKSEEGIPVSYVVKNAALWGVLLPLSSGSRSQIVKGLDRLVQASPLAKQVPLAALAFAVGMRFASNIYGGLLFVHWANWSGMMKRGS
nr:protein RETICULATA, chloroplastic-like isoform X2 [Coffea arabica]